MDDGTTYCATDPVPAQSTGSGPVPFVPMQGIGTSRGGTSPAEKAKPKIFLLYLKTGGGHLAPARAVAQYIETLHPGEAEPVLVDGFEGVSAVIRKSVEDGYRHAQARTQWVFEALYAVNKIPAVAHSSGNLVSRFIRPVLEKRILRDRPAKIVIFHFFLIKPVYFILKKYGLDIPVTTVVTDPYTAHPIWFLQKGQDLVVFSDELREKLEKRRKPAGSVNVFPFIVKDEFSEPLPEADVPALRGRYGFDPGKRLVLLLGGGDGMPRGRSVLKRLLKAGTDAQFGVVCGHDKRLYRRMCELRDRYPDRTVRVFGYVDFVRNLIGIADVVITKCGASTFMEILLSRRIPVINTFIWEQEKGNVEYVTDNGLGVYEKSLRRLPDVIGGLLEDPERARTFRENIGKTPLANGAPLVAEYIMKN